MGDVSEKICPFTNSKFKLITYKLKAKCDLYQWAFLKLAVIRFRLDLDCFACNNSGAPKHFPIMLAQYLRQLVKFKLSHNQRHT